MRKPPANLNKLRASKNGSLNWSEFNFLENLLVFRTMEEHSVPSESGVKFRISREANDHGICLLIHIDDQCYPVMEPGVIRPDYLAIYLHGSGCICTIIEMKGRDEKRLRHGLEQIQTLAARLTEEFRTHLPPNFRLHIQGILLCPFNAQVPNELIKKMSAGGLTILPASCANRAELYSYVSQKNSLKDGFRNATRHPAPLSQIEQMMSQGTLKKRISPPRISPGLHIDFMLSDDEFATLVTRGKKCVFVVSEQGDQHQVALQADIDTNDLGRKFSVEAAPR